MDEAMKSEWIGPDRVEQIFTLADEILRAPSRFTKAYVVEHLAAGVADLSGALDRARAELEQLRARVAEIGDTDVEWAVRWYAEGEAVYHHKDSHAAAQHYIRLWRQRGVPKYASRLAIVRAIVGEWREVGDEDATDAAVPLAPGGTGAALSGPLTKSGPLGEASPELEFDRPPTARTEPYGDPA